MSELTLEERIVFEREAHKLRRDVFRHDRAVYVSDFAFVMLELENLVRLFHTVHIQLCSHRYMNDIEPSHMEWDKIVPLITQIILTTDPVQPGKQYNSANQLRTVTDGIRFVMLKLTPYFEHDQVQYRHGLDMVHWMLHGKQFRPGTQQESFNRMRRPQGGVHDVMASFEWQDHNNRLSERRNIGAGVGQDMFRKMYAQLEDIKEKKHPYSF